MTTRNQVADALLALLIAGGQFTKTGRRLTAPEEAADVDAPGLFLIKMTEGYTRESQGTPPKRKLEFHAVVYTCVGDDPNAVPAAEMDDLLDVIDAQLKPAAKDALGNNGRQTLGGLVFDCRINGEIDIAPGDVPGRGLAVIPIEVTLP